jgi:trimeric autotransporter adhesin
VWSSVGTGPENGVNGAVRALTVFDGRGRRLHGGWRRAGEPDREVERHLVVVPRDRPGERRERTVLALTVFDDGLTAGMNGSVRALTVFDDGTGSGPALYAGGDFTTADGVPANRIAKWNGTVWSSVGTGPENGVNGAVRALTVFDDGSGNGPALYAGGDFTAAGGVLANRIAKWSGTSWSSLGTGPANGVNSTVLALTVFDDGSGGGPALYAGGIFTTAGGVPANRIAKWNGTSWSSLGTGSANGIGGVGTTVEALAVFDDGLGEGPALYAGGFFTTAGGVTANRIAKWNGTSWSSLGTGSANGVSGNSPVIFALTVFDDGSGSGPALYAGGGFTTAGGVLANRIAKWDGSSWSPLGTGSANGVSGNGAPSVSALMVFDGGSGGGPALYAGGTFMTAGGVPANRIAKWNGSSWSPLMTGLANGVSGNAAPSVSALMVFDDGSGDGAALYAGGGFGTAGGVPANRIAKWNGTSWSSLFTGSPNGVNNWVSALAVFDDGSGSGPALYAGGQFTTAGGVTANRIAKWNGTAWSSLGTGTANGVSGGSSAITISTLTVFDDGSGGGPALYAGGDFAFAGGIPANRIAKWDGTSWSSLGTGSANGVNSSVRALMVFDDGSGGGPALYVGGGFWTAGGIPANRIAKWNGTAWSSLGTGSANGVSGSVSALEVFDDGLGGGPALYAGGSFESAGGVPANRIAKWNGTSWSSLGTGSANGVNNGVSALKVFDDGLGGGPALYAGGNFESAGGVVANRIAKWNGISWSSLGTGSANGVSGSIEALTVFDDGSGSGPALYAGGILMTAGGVPANRIAKWNGTSWSSLGTGPANGVNSMVLALTVFDDGSGSGPALYAGGQFTTAGGAPSSHFAKWGCDD